MRSPYKNQSKGLSKPYDSLITPYKGTPFSNSTTPSRDEPPLEPIVTSKRDAIMELYVSSEEAPLPLWN